MIIPEIVPWLPSNPLGQEAQLPSNGLLRTWLNSGSKNLDIEINIRNIFTRLLNIKVLN